MILKSVVVVVVVVTQHGGEATFAEAATSSNPKTQKTQGTFQVEKEWYQPERRRWAMEGRIA